MGRTALIAVIVALFLLVGGAVGVYAYDRSKQDEIAEGVRVAKVDVSGMSGEEARRKVRASVVAPLRKPVTVLHDGTRYVLAPEKLRLRSDVDAMVDQALAVSREGGLPTRVWRYLSGGEVNRAIQPSVSYSEDAVRDFVAKIAEDVDREAVDATVEPTPAELKLIGGEPGRTLRADALREQVEAAIQDPARRPIEAEVDEVEPEVSKAEVAAQYPTYITVDRNSFKLRLWKDLKLDRTYTIAVGAVGFDTPAGVYNIQNKAVDPAWHVPEREWAGELAGTVVPGGVAENPLKERWMGIYDGAGIHGTDEVGSLGSRASHGCVRMAIPDVKDLYEHVDVGTPIYIG